LLLFHALAHLEVVQARAQALPGHVAVAVLAAAVLALHHDAGGDVRQAHGRVGLVDVLTARARGAVGVGAHVGRVDVDLDRVVDLGVDEQRANEVWRPPELSNGDLRTRRCTPVSVRSRP
jgi:hypothetical protein